KRRPVRFHPTHNATFTSCCLLAFEFLSHYFHFTPGRRKLTRPRQRRQQCCTPECSKNSVSMACCDWPSPCSPKVRAIGLICSSCCYSEILFTSGWSQSRRSGSIGCLVTRASCTWATSFSESPARTFSA